MKNGLDFKRLAFTSIYLLIINFNFGQNKNDNKTITKESDSVKSEKAIALVLTYTRLAKNRDLDSLIALSDTQFKRVFKIDSKHEKIDIYKTLDELRNSLEKYFNKGLHSVLLTLDTIYISRINKKVLRKKNMYDEIYFVTMLSRYTGGESNTEKKLNTLFVVRMKTNPKIIGVIEE